MGIGTLSSCTTNGSNTCTQPCLGTQGSDQNLVVFGTPNCQGSNCTTDSDCPGQSCIGGQCQDAQAGIVCNTQGSAFTTCPDNVVQSLQQSCAQAAQAAGCYNTGSGPVTCTSYRLFTCSRNTAAEVDTISGQNCGENPSSPSTTKPAPPTNFCGTWQIDCYSGPAGFEGGIDKSDCGATTSPSPGVSPPPDDRRSCPGEGGNCFIIADLTDPNNPGNPVNCGVVGKDEGSSEATQTCGEGRICCVAKGGALPGGCAGVWVYKTVPINSSYPSLNPNPIYTIENLALLKPGTVVYLGISGMGISDSYGKARFSVNGAAPTETTRYITRIDRFGTGRRAFWLPYTIPAGITSFTIVGDIYSPYEGPNGRWF